MDNVKEKKIHGAEIICVGTELLMGHTLNTNAGYLARQLAELGIPSFRQTVVGDNAERLALQIKESAGRSDLVIFTGGLGPTADDLTMKTAAAVAGLPMVMHDPSYRSITSFFERIGRTMTENNLKQAMLPTPAIVFQNTNGTAPGAMFDCPAPNQEDPNHVAKLILLPGPPSEVVPMFMISVRPLLEEMAPFSLRSTYVHLIGIGESAAETKIRDLIDSQVNPTIAPYAAEGECMFRVTQRINSDSDPDLITPLINELRERFGDNIYEIGTRSMKEVAYELLLSKEKTISFAESCTSGMVSSELGDIPGASKVFSGSVVSYDNRIKTAVLGVPEAVLISLGAVSEECAILMAKGCRKLMRTDVAVAITGIAGPDGASEGKPVGLVYLAIADEEGTEVKKIMIYGNRMRIRRVAALEAFNLIRTRIS